MRISYALASAVALLMLDVAAIAAGRPKLAGAYAYTIISPCQAKLTTTRNSDGALTGINGYFGEINHEMGTATFKAGTLVVVGLLVKGSLLNMDGHGGNLSGPVATSMNVVFSNTATTVTIGGKTWPAIYGNIDSSNIAHYMSFLNRDEVRCATTGTFVRKQ
jgi:hypothetical protein